MCKIHRLLYALLPSRRWKSRLLRRSVDSCPRCLREEGQAAGAVEAFLKPGWIRSAPSLWLRVSARIDASPNPAPDSGRKAAASGLPFWKLAAVGASVFLALCAAGFFLWKSHLSRISGSEFPSPAEVRGSEPRVRVVAVELKGRPAKPYVFQTPKASYIWVAPSKETGG